jgi:hypothetical protein
MHACTRQGTGHGAQTHALTPVRTLACTLQYMIHYTHALGSLTVCVYSIGRLVVHMHVHIISLGNVTIRIRVRIWIIKIGVS